MTQKYKRYLAGAILPLLAALGCDYDENTRMALAPVSVNHALTQMSSCDDYEAYVKKSAKQRMRAMITRECQSMWDDVDNRNDDVLRGGFDNSVDKDVAAGAGDGAPAPEMSGDDANGEEGDFSRTNTQEAGVDEADLVKTDGDYLYAVSGRDLVIVAIDEAGTLTETGRITLDGRPQELFIKGGTAVVFSALGSNDVPEEILLPGPPDQSNLNLPKDVEPSMPTRDPESYYYDTGTYTGIDVIDLSDKTEPALIRNVRYAGSYVSSRRIGGAVRAVLSSPMAALDVPTWVYVDYWDMGESRAKETINDACEELIAANEAYIDALTLADLLPKKYEAGDDAVSPVAACGDILGPKTPAGTGLLTVVSLDLDAPAEPQTDISIIGEEGQVYAGTKALYLTTASEYVQSAWESGLWDEETSGIHKFDIESDPKAAKYIGSGTAGGRMLDQFSLGEQDDYLRVAVTTGSAWSRSGNTLDNHIQIFEENGSALKVVGELEGIGTEEEIYAVRFMGDRGFVVTYLQTDPLFTLDLSDPTNPKKVGEWLGPGYSTYLHPYGQDLIIAMGKDENWRTVISLYDVSDFSEPKLVERQPLEMDNYETAAVYEHKAFTFNPESGDLMLPYHDWDNDTGVLLYNITDTGVSLSGSLDMDGDARNEGPARRAMYNGDILIGVGACRIATAALDNPATLIASLPIYGDACEFPTWY